MSQEWRVWRHFRLNAPERLRALQTLNAAHRATDITSLVGAEEGPLSLASRPWTLLTRMRVGLPLDVLDTRFCPGCGAAMDGFGDHVLSCHKLGIYARHNEVRNELAGIYSELNLRVEVEQGPDGSSLRLRAIANRAGPNTSPCCTPRVDSITYPSPISTLAFR